MSQRNRSAIDDIMDAYVDWRQRSVEVEAAYGRWSAAGSADAAFAFAAYSVALDREESASLAYAHLLRTSDALAA